MEKILILLFSVFCSIQAIKWQQSARDQGQIEFSGDCDFQGHDIAQVRTSNSNCGPTCLARPDCSTFAWSNGICYLKNGGQVISNSGVMCGRIPKRNSVKILIRLFKISNF